MRAPTVLCLAILAIIVLVCADVAHGKNDNKNNKGRDNKGKADKNNKGKGNKGKGRKGKTDADGGSNNATGNCSVPAAHLDKLGGLKCHDKESVIADLSFMGRNDTCEGLTPDLFVQTANCLWNTQCNLTYNSSKATNYMIKLHSGAPSCIVLAPEHFHFNFSCANKGVISDVISEDGASTKTLSSASGLLRSHAQQPWHYNGHGEAKAYNVTLQRPSDGGSRFCFTFRKYHLSHGDSLEIGPWHSDKAQNWRVGSTQCLLETREVRVSLTLSYMSHGAEGFLLCYSWQDKETTNDLCAKLLTLEPCPRLRKKEKDGTTRKPKRNDKKKTK